MEKLLESKYIDDVYVDIDFDKKEIEHIVKDFDKFIFFNRRDELCKKETTIVPLLDSFIERYRIDGKILQTHVTNPLVKHETFRRLIDRSNELDTDIFSVTKLKKRLYWKNGIEINHDKNKLIETQELEEIYEENSCIYIFKANNFRKEKTRITKNSKMVEISQIEAIDIDEEWELKMCDSLLKHK